MPRLLLTVVCLTSFASFVFAQDQVHYRFEEGEGVDVVDDESGDVHGELVDFPEFSDDAPDCLDGPNEFSIDFTIGGYARMNGDAGGIPFMFHDALAGGAVGDATVEWFIKVPFASSHASMIWSNGDDNADANRFNISHDLSCCGLPADFATGDYRDPGGTLGGIGSPTHTSERPIPYDEWVHIAITRTDLGDGSWGWEWYYNGEQNPVQSAVTVTALPTAQSWLIAGRSGGHSFNALIDEFRLTAQVLEPDQLLCFTPTDCPVAGDQDFEDTHCNGLEIDPPANDPLPPAGEFTVTVAATDVSGDQIRYAFSAEDELLNVTAPDSKSDNQAVFTFGPGMWTVTVTADDSTQCDDDAADSVCVAQIEVGESVPYPDRFYYRFEEGEGEDVVDDVTGDAHGVIMGGALFSTDVPLQDINGEDNGWSIDFVGGGWLRMSAFAFAFHDPLNGGAPGDVTLEWYMSVPERGSHASMWWSNDDDQGDANRFNINHDLSCCGLPADIMTGDYRDPVGTIAGIGAPDHNSGVPVQYGRWNHLAIRRTDMGDGTWSWDWYYNHEHNPIQDAVTDLPLPTAKTWLVAGRQGANSNLNARFDEIRITTEALDPEDFLPPAVVCPSEGDEDFQDTRCVSMEIDAPPDGLEGLYTATATGEDTTGDDITYRFRANDGFTEIEPDFQDDNVAEFFLSRGIWDITCFIDDTGCLDTTLKTPGDAICTETVEIDPIPPPEPVPAYYRFEEGEGFDVTDELSGDVHGELVDGPLFSSDVPVDPIPLTGAANEFSIDFTVGGYAFIQFAPFAFHDPLAGGAEGDATLEWYMKVPIQESHASMFWTNGDTNVNINRFNLSHDQSCCGRAPDIMTGDYRNPGGLAVSIGANDHNGGIPVPYDEWIHLAITREDNGDGSWTWSWFYDGVANPAQEAVTFEQLPNATSWVIAGRSGGHSMNALFDEVKMTHEALDPAAFLNSGDCEATEPNGEVSCADEVDNDCDGATDGDDTDCPDVTGVGPFIRGDCDGNGVVGGSPTEAIVLLNFSFRGAAAPGCIAACDAEANGSVGVTDALRILRFAFLGQGEPDAPFPNCTVSALGTDVELGCEVSSCTP